MLVLGRRQGERIWIGTPEGDVWITYLGLHHGVARLRIEAPRHIRVDREEIRQQRLQETEGKTPPEVSA